MPRDELERPQIKTRPKPRVLDAFVAGAEHKLVAEPTGEPPRPVPRPTNVALDAFVDGDYELSPTDIRTIVLETAGRHGRRSKGISSVIADAIECED